MFSKLFENKSDDIYIIDIILNSNKTYNIGYLTNKMFKNLKDTGSYIIIVNSYFNDNNYYNDINDDFNGPTAVYCISKSHKMQDGYINALSKSTDINENYIELEWNKGEFPLLKYKSVSKNTIKKKLRFKIKIITNN